MLEPWFPTYSFHHPSQFHRFAIRSFDALLFALVVGMPFDVWDPTLEWDIGVGRFVEIGKVSDSLFFPHLARYDGGDLSRIAYVTATVTL